jgi:hypothetical protein
MADAQPFDSPLSPDRQPPSREASAGGTRIGPMARADAEEFLDWLESTGVTNWRLFMSDDGFFVGCP